MNERINYLKTYILNDTIHKGEHRQVSGWTN